MGLVFLGLDDAVAYVLPFLGSFRSVVIGPKVADLDMVRDSFGRTVHIGVDNIRDSRKYLRKFLLLKSHLFNSQRYEFTKVKVYSLDASVRLWVIRRCGRQINSVRLAEVTHGLTNESVVEAYGHGWSKDHAPAT